MHRRGFSSHPRQHQRARSSGGLTRDCPKTSQFHLFGRGRMGNPHAHVQSWPFSCPFRASRGSACLDFSTDFPKPTYKQGMRTPRRVSRSFSSARRVRWKKTSLDPHPGSSRCAGGFQSSLQAGMAQNLFRAACRRSNAPPCNHWLLRGMGMARKPCVPVASVYHPTIAPPGFMPRAWVTVAPGNVRDANDPSSSRKP